jgi:hypothetical protein
MPENVGLRFISVIKGCYLQILRRGYLRSGYLFYITTFIIKLVDDLFYGTIRRFSNNRI